ncbi:cysteine and tyrosine-rich protein 1-like [Argopecten irradians]|uniref:cysteine and tyrosine-rich protein 1-like n=1 Tax=Argopecten irradians TaxID=31199 RepID=UPI003712DA04
MAGLGCMVILLVFVAVTVEADYCTFNNGSIIFCGNGCCGGELDYCCNIDSGIVAYYYSLTGAAIAGIVIGSIIFLALIVCGIACIVYFVNSNCCEQQGNTGVVFSNSACANPTPVTSVNIAEVQPSLAETRTTYLYPQSTAHVYKGGYGYM